jgi:hypothetical protein
MQFVGRRVVTDAPEHTGKVLTQMAELSTPWSRAMRLSAPILNAPNGRSGWRDVGLSRVPRRWVGNDRGGRCRISGAD